MNSRQMRHGASVIALKPTHFADTHAQDGLRHTTRGQESRRFRHNDERRTRSVLPLVFLLLALLTGNDLNAQDDNLVVRSQIEPADAVYVGQRVLFRVDVLARDVWANLPVTVSVEIPGAVVTVPPNSSIRLSEQIGGGSFIGQRYEWWIYPQRRGKLKIPAQQLNVQLKPLAYGKEPEYTSASTTPLSIEVTYPEGVPVGTGVICANEFRAEQTWEPSETQFNVGDGITRSIDRTIDDTPAMILSPIEHSDIAGVKTYVKQPQVDDRFNRGELTGHRTDSVTYWFEKPGKVQLPRLRFSYWDLASGKLETIDLEGMTLDVSPATHAPADTTAAAPNRSLGIKPRHLALIVVLIAIVMVIVRYRDVLAQKTQIQLRKFEDSEFNQFRKFLSAARTQAPMETLRTLVHWLDVASPNDPAPRLDRFLDLFGDKETTKQLALLEAAVDSKASALDTGALVDGLKRARHRWLLATRHRNTETKNPLPPLHPPSRSC